MLVAILGDGVNIREVQLLNQQLMQTFAKEQVAAPTSWSVLYGSTCTLRGAISMTCYVASSWRRPLALALSNVAKRLIDACEPNSIRRLVLGHRIPADDDPHPLAVWLAADCRERLMQGTMNTFRL